jgi:hypothetical protein
MFAVPALRHLALHATRTTGIHKWLHLQTREDSLSRATAVEFIAYRLLASQSPGATAYMWPCTYRQRAPLHEETTSKSRRSRRCEHTQGRGSIHTGRGSRQGCAHGHVVPGPCRGIIKSREYLSIDRILL